MSLNHYEGLPCCVSTAAIFFKGFLTQSRHTSADDRGGGGWTRVGGGEGSSGTDSETLTEAEHTQGPEGPEASEQGDADGRRAEDSADGIFNTL